MTHVPVPTKAPKSVKTQYFVTVLKPNQNVYDTCLLCKNYTEAKKLYKEYVKQAHANELVSILVTVLRDCGKETIASDIIIARTAG